MSIRERLEDLRLNGTNLTRYTVYKDGKEVSYSSGSICIGSHKRDKHICVSEGTTVGFAYNGESHPNSRGPRGKMEGGPLSLAWLCFMLDPVNSPWLGILPHVTNADDLNWINDKGGIILERTPEIGCNLLGSFWISIRFAQEKNKVAVWWKELIDKHGLTPKQAFAVAMCINERGYEIAHDFHFCQSGYARNWMRAMYSGEGNNGEPCSGVGGMAGGDDLWGTPIPYNQQLKLTGATTELKIANILAYLETK